MRITWKSSMLILQLETVTPKKWTLFFWSYSWLWLIHTVDLVIFWFLSVVCLALVDCSDLSDFSSVVGSDIVSDVSTASSSTFSSSFHCFISSSTLPAVLPLVTPCYINKHIMTSVRAGNSLVIGHNMYMKQGCPQLGGSGGTPNDYLLTPK